MHGQQPGGLIDGQLAIRPSFHVEVRYAGVAFIKKIKIALKLAILAGHLTRRFISADQLHNAPLRSQLREARSSLMDFDEIPPSRMTEIPNSATPRSMCQAEGQQQLG